MNKKTQSIIYNFLGFAAIFLLVRYFINEHTYMQDLWRTLSAFVVATLISPKFNVVQTPQGEKLFMRWIFFKGVKEL